MKEDPTVTPTEKNSSNFDKFLNFYTESCLVVTFIPVIILFFLACVTGTLLMTEYVEYKTWVLTKKFATAFSGGNADDVSDHLEAHLRGSAVCGFIIVLLFGQILFVVVKPLYKFTGAIMFLAIIGSLAWQCVWAVWIANNECEDTAYYRLALTNTIIQFVLFVLILIASIILCLVQWCKSDPEAKHAVAPQSKEDNDSPRDKRETEMKALNHDEKTSVHKEKEGQEWVEPKNDKSDMGNSWDNIKGDKNPKEEEKEKNLEYDEEEDDEIY